MGKRTLPFGYRMENGQPRVNPLEAETVQFIFNQYILGLSLQRLTYTLRAGAVSYSSGKLWNKNMVARILEDNRYTGAQDFPAMIPKEDMEAVRQIRSARKQPVPKSPVQTALRQLSGHTATPQIEEQALQILNKIIENPACLCSPLNKTDSEPSNMLRTRLDSLMRNQLQKDREEQIKAVMYQLATSQYRQINGNKYETERLQRLFAAASPMQTLDAALLKSAVTSIRVLRSGAVQLELKNHQVFGGNADAG